MTDYPIQPSRFPPVSNWPARRLILKSLENHHSKSAQGHYATGQFLVKEYTTIGHASPNSHVGCMYMYLYRAEHRVWRGKGQGWGCLTAGFLLRICPLIPNAGDSCAAMAKLMAKPGGSGGKSKPSSSNKSPGGVKAGGIKKAFASERNGFKKNDSSIKKGSFSKPSFNGADKFKKKFSLPMPAVPGGKLSS